MEPYKADLHCHSTNSHDGKCTVTDMCISAINAGVNEIAFTDHYDPNDSLHKTPCYNYSNYAKDICKARELYSGKLLVKSAVELGDVHLHHTFSKKLVNSMDFDFVLFSNHSVGFGDLWFLDFDKYNTLNVIEQYYINICNALGVFDDFDVLAHIDLPKRYFHQRNIPYDIKWFDDYIDEVLRIIIKKGKGLEVNTSTLRIGLNAPMPRLYTLERYKELGGEILTFGSDSHDTSSIYNDIDFAQKLAQAAGFKYFATFTKRKCDFHKMA